MSLINEALKRTRDNSFQTGAARPMTVDSYRLANGSDALSSNARTGMWVSVLAVVIAGVCMLLVALRVFRPAHQVSDAFSVMESPEASPQNVPYRINPGVPGSPNPPPVGIATVPYAPQLVTVVEPAPEPAVVAPVAEPPAPEPPKFTLQGITSAAKWREAMINGYTVREGDEIDGARVVSIESRRVALQLGGREIVLRMP